MNRPILLLVGGAVIGAILYYRNQVAGSLQTGAEDVQSAVSGWSTVNEGPTWVPVLNAAEVQFGIPTNLLARLAYEESRFRQDVITGETPSSAGALGLMQLEPQYFTSAQAALPFTSADTTAQISQAAQQLQGLFTHYNDWTLALAAYNDGEGNVDSYVAGTRALPAETATYVAQITADVPVAGKLA